MPSLLKDIKSQSDWIVNAFKADNLKLDYSIHSFIEIDKFFNKHSKNGKAVKKGRLSQNLGAIIFSIGSYVGQTIIKNVPGALWQVDDNDPQGEITASVKFPDGTIMWPMQKVMKRFQNGSEDAIYVYGHHVTKEYIEEPFDESFWETTSDQNEVAKKPWWKFW
jgi:hypothetical protein